MGGRVASVETVTGKIGAGGVSLALPAAYVATSPVSRLLDALTLLSNPQTVAVFISAVFIVLVTFAVTRRGKTSTWRIWMVRFFGVLVAISITEAAVALCPRPMAALRVNNPNVVVADFHSHTGASHDVRKSYTAEDNRAWHRDAGFNVAWITDHVKFGGVVAARPHNPRTAGEGVSLLSGVEGRYHRIMSTIVLGLDERDTALLNNRGNLLPGLPAAGTRPVTIIALPNRNLDSVTVQAMDSVDNFVAIELIDAAPRGLGQFDREEDRVRTLASRLGLALVAASNNHGFGHTAAAWNLITVPQWRSLSPDSLGRTIEQRFRERDVSAVTIVARARPRTHGATLAATFPVMLFQVLGGLTPSERIAWIVWIWAITGLVVYLSGRRSNAA